MNKKVDVIATYRLLLTKPAVGDKERVADIVVLTTLAPASVDELEAYIKSHAGTAPEETPPRPTPKSGGLIFNSSNSAKPLPPTTRCSP